MDAEEHGRRAELMARVALVLHIMRHGVAAADFEIPLPTVIYAERILQWADAPWARVAVEEQRKKDDDALKSIAGCADMKTGLPSDGVKRLLGFHKYPGGGPRTEAFLKRAIIRRRIREIPPAGGERKPRYALA
jgi:hypothetical protein